MAKLTSEQMQELRQYWEVPAIAHFCSLFRQIFKLIDYDIEDLEEALYIDSTCRHSLVVDLLIALLKGCTGRKDVTLLNYNQFLYDLIAVRWEEEGRGECRHPLGRSRDAANFHTLPLYPKLKLLHWLCELRLQRPDVEVLTKNLDGESLRVIALGKDDKGAAYWYFYGTRLYKEEPEPLKLKFHLPRNDSPERSTTPNRKKGKKRGKRRREENESEQDEDFEVPAPKSSSTDAARRPKRAASTSTKTKKGKAEERKAPSPLPSRRSMRQAAKRGFPVLDEMEPDEPKSEEEQEEEEEYAPSESDADTNTRASSLIPSEAGTEEGEERETRTKPSLIMRLKPQMASGGDETSRDSWRESSVASAEDPDASRPPFDSAESSRDASVIGNRTIKDMIDRMYSREEDEEDELSRDISEAPATDSLHHSRLQASPSPNPPIVSLFLSLPYSREEDEEDELSRDISEAPATDSLHHSRLQASPSPNPPIVSLFLSLSYSREEDEEDELSRDISEAPATDSLHHSRLQASPSPNPPIVSLFLSLSYSREEDEEDELSRDISEAPATDSLHHSRLQASPSPNPPIVSLFLSLSYSREEDEEDELSRDISEAPATDSLHHSRLQASPSPNPPIVSLFLSLSYSREEDEEDELSRDISEAPATDSLHHSRLQASPSPNPPIVSLFLSLSYSREEDEEDELSRDISEAPATDSLHHSRLQASPSPNPPIVSLFLSLSYSREEDEEDELSRDISEAPATDSLHHSRLQASPSPNPPLADDTMTSMQTDVEVAEMDVSENLDEPVNVEKDDPMPEIAKEETPKTETGETTETSPEEVKSEEVDGEVKEEEVELEGGVPAWDQPFLTAQTSSTSRWKLECTTLEEWRSLAESLSRSRSKSEKALFNLLQQDFLPEMESMFQQKENEREKRLAELNRRTSERVEVRRLQEEAEKEKLSKREAEERQKLEMVETARRRKLEAEEREKRRREREKERDRASKLRDRAKEERGRRLQYRQQRQEMMANGEPIPDELLQHPGGLYGEKDLNELDIEIELDHTYGQLEKVIDQLKKHPDSDPFISPVTEEVAPDYAERIETPMCIETIEDKLLEKAYNNKIEFIDDVNLIFLNCLEYNGLDSEYTRLAQQFERGFIRAWRKYFPPTAESIADNERAQREAWQCVQRLGALDKRINEILRPQPPPPKPAPPRTLAYSLASAPSTSSARTLPYSITSTKKSSNLPPPARAPYGSNAAYRLLTPTRTLGASSGGVMKYGSALRIQSGTVPPLGPPGTQQRRVFMPTSSNSNPTAIRVLGTPQGTIVRRPSNPYQAQQPTTRIISNFNPVRVATPRPQVIRTTAPVTQKPSVYLLPSQDGENRLLKFVTKSGEPAPHELVQHLLPQLKKEAHKLPKGLLTLTIDSQEVGEGGFRVGVPIRPPNPEQAGPSLPSTSTAPPDLGPPHTEEKKETPEQAKSKRFYHIGDNSYLAIEDGNPYLYKKQDNGSLMRVQQVSRDGLLEKLKRIQQNKTEGQEPRPVCSVAPQVSVSKASVARQPTSTYLVSASSALPQAGGGTMLVVPSASAPSHQTLLLPNSSTTTYLIQQPNPAPQVASAAEEPEGRRGWLKVIQILQPAQRTIVVSRAGEGSAAASTSAPSVLQSPPPPADPKPEEIDITEFFVPDPNLPPP